MTILRLLFFKHHPSWILKYRTLRLLCTSDMSSNYRSLQFDLFFHTLNNSSFLNQTKTPPFVGERAVSRGLEVVTVLTAISLQKYQCRPPIQFWRQTIDRTSILCKVCTRNGKRKLRGCRYFSKTMQFANS